MADILMYILLICMIGSFLFHAINEIQTFFRSVLEYRTDKKFEETYPSIEPEYEENTTPRWNVEEFRRRMENIKIDENGLFDFPDVPITNEESGAEIITDSYENEFERNNL